MGKLKRSPDLLTARGKGMEGKKDRGERGNGIGRGRKTWERERK